MGARASHWSGWQSDTGPLVPAHYHARSSQRIHGQNHRARSLPINQLDALVIHLHHPQPRLTSGAFLFPSARRAPSQTHPRLRTLPAWTAACSGMLTPGILEPIAFQAGSQSHDVALWRAFRLAWVCLHQGSHPAPQIACHAEGHSGSGSMSVDSSSPSSGTWRYRVRFSTG